MSLLISVGKFHQPPLSVPNYKVIYEPVLFKHLVACWTLSQMLLLPAYHQGSEQIIFSSELMLFGLWCHSQCGELLFFLLYGYLALTT